MNSQILRLPSTFMADWDVPLEARRMHELNKKWWHDLHTGERLDLNKGERLMLVNTELSEAFEAYRKNLQDDHLPQYAGEKVEIVDTLIRLFDLREGYGLIGPLHTFNVGYIYHATANVGEVLFWLSGKLQTLHASFAYDGAAFDCDYAIQCVFWYAHWRGFYHELREIYEAKVAYNQVRVDHTREHRLTEHGKKM